MKIIVDSNIIFSAILNSNGKIGDILIDSENQFTFIAPEFLRYEIKGKYEKLQSISGLNLEQLLETEYRVCKTITFISEEQVGEKFWVKANELLKGIDTNDVHYVAYSMEFKCKIWTATKSLLTV